MFLRFIEQLRVTILFSLYSIYLSLTLSHSLSVIVSSDSLNSLELLYGEAVSRADLDGVEAEAMRVALVLKRQQEKRERARADINESASRGEILVHIRDRKN